MSNKRFDISFSRRQWMGLAASGALGSASLKGLGTGATASTSDHRVTLKAGELEAMVVDNHDGLSGDEQKKRRAAIPSVPGGLGQLYCTVPFEERFNGYNGIPRLRHRDSHHPFLTSASGLNCEFFFDEKRWSFEPRWKDIERFQAQPSRVKAISDSEAHLEIEAGEDWGIKVETTFRLEAPYFLDLEHSFTPTREDKIPGGFLGAFWASYIQAPRNPGYYVWGRVSPRIRPSWHNIYDALNLETVGVIGAERGPVGGSLRGPAKPLIYDLSPVRYVEPLMVGRVHDMLLAFLFQPAEDLEIRPAFNAQGGGVGVPAWDYQAVVPNPKVGRRYSFKVRVVYKPFEGLDEALDLQRQWKDRILKL